MYFYPFQTQLEDILRPIVNDEVSLVEKLEEAGVKGEPEITCFCPVANYVRAQIPVTFENLHVLVDGERVVISDDPEWFANSDEATLLATLDTKNTQISRFVAEFDDGDYPQFYTPQYEAFLRKQEEQPHVYYNVDQRKMMGLHE